MNNNSSGRYSQDQDWRVLEPEEAHVSETELAEIRRLRDSTSRAEGQDPSAPLFSPLLPPPKNIVTPPKSIPSAPPLPELPELAPFHEHFPGTFEDSLIKTGWNHVYSPEYTDDEVAMMIVALEMKKLVMLQQLPTNHPCTKALKSLQTRILSSHFPTMEMLLKVLIISALDMKLPEDLARERAQTTALDYLIENLEGQKIIPPSPKIEKALSEALLKAILFLVNPSIAHQFTKQIIFALKMEKKLLHEIESITPKKSNPIKVEEHIFLQPLTSEDKAAFYGCLLISLATLQNIKPLLCLLIRFVQEIRDDDDGNHLAEAFLYGLEITLSQALSESAIEQIVKIIFFMGQIFKKMGLIESLVPAGPKRSIMENFVDRLSQHETRFAEKISSRLERQLSFVGPSHTQTRLFAKMILGPEEFYMI